MLESPFLAQVVCRSRDGTTARDPSPVLPALSGGLPLCSGSTAVRLACSPSQGCQCVGRWALPSFPYLSALPARHIGPRPSRTRSAHSGTNQASSDLGSAIRNLLSDSPSPIPTPCLSLIHDYSYGGTEKRFVYIVSSYCHLRLTIFRRVHCSRIQRPTSTKARKYGSSKSQTAVRSSSTRSVSINALSVRSRIDE